MGSSPRFTEFTVTGCDVVYCRLLMLMCAEVYIVVAVDPSV